MTHDLTWTAPPPFWSAAPATDASALGEPQLLRFANDEFVAELLSTLEQDPAKLPRYVAQAETWRGPGTAPAPNPRLWLQREPMRFLGARRKALAQKRASLAAPSTESPSELPLKLYQPAHQRHYLVSGALVCKTPGLPDRQIDPARHKTSFVLRRLFPKAGLAVSGKLPEPTDRTKWDEYAYVLEGKAGLWRRIGAADSESAVALLWPSEERLALSPAPYVDDAQRTRRLYLGTVPVGRREAYQGAAAEASGGGTAVHEKRDPRVVMFHTLVLGPWKALVNQAMQNGPQRVDLKTVNAEAPSTDTVRNTLSKARPVRVFLRDKNAELGYNDKKPDDDALRTVRGGLQTASWYVLADLYGFLEQYLKGELLQPILAKTRPSGPAGTLYDALSDAQMPSALRKDTTTPPLTGEQDASITQSTPFDDNHVVLNLLDALRKVATIGYQDFKAMLDAQDSAFTLPPRGTAPKDGWPDFLFLFADPWFGVLQPPIPGNFAPPADDYLSEKVQALLDTLAKLVAEALPALADGEVTPEPTLASMLPADMRDAWYVIRMVYERPDCAPFHGDVISAPTRPFQMAGFFDPDAPARPIRIGLPVDISPAGLRKFDKNAVFMMSDMLCGQVDRMKGIGLADLVLSVLPWPFHKELSVPEKGPCADSLGVMCSLSIPIITICALLLLMIIVSLLELIFHWMPWFILCFPLPGFKGKKE